MSSLRGKTLFITGASRGIGKAIALRAAQEGARIAIAAKTAEPHPKLPGTIHSAAAEIVAAGGEALPLAVDIRSEEQVEAAVAKTVAAFGAIDILVNNASALFLAGTVETSMKRFDLMHQVNVRGTYLCSRACIPHLRAASLGHILNISPPLSMKPKWFANHTAYTIAKYGMSMCVLGMAEELKSTGVAVNALWPRTAIATAAVENLLGGKEMIQRSRKPAIMADAAHAILTAEPPPTGNFFIDDEVLAAAGVTDLSGYAVDPTLEPVVDFFLD